MMKTKCSWFIAKFLNFLGSDYLNFFIYREPHRPVFNRTKSEIRPLYNRLTPHGAVLTRSPMVSLIFPSLKDKIKMFQDESKKKGQNRVNSSMFVKRQELENIVEQEKKKRNVTDNWMAWINLNFYLNKVFQFSKFCLYKYISILLNNKLLLNNVTVTKFRL